MNFLILLSVLFAVSSSVKLPSIFKRCKINDQICLRDAVQEIIPKLKDGLPELGVPSLDPMHISEMTIGAGQNVVQLTQKYKNAELSGISDCKITDLNLDMDLKTLTIKFTFPLWVLNATYELSGRILLLPVFGTGPCSLTFENGNTFEVFNLETYQKKDQTYLKATNATLDGDIQKATYKFDNLFNGDKALGDNINTVINENWREVYEEVREGYAKVYSASFMNMFNKIFAKVPMEEVFLK